MSVVGKRLGKLAHRPVTKDETFEKKVKLSCHRKQLMIKSSKHATIKQLLIYKSSNFVIMREWYENLPNMHRSGPKTARQCAT